MVFSFTSSISSPKNIPENPDLEGDDWRKILSESIRDPDELIELLALPDSLREPARQAARLFPLVVPRGYLARMTLGNPHDPLLAQVLPLETELTLAAGFLTDPVGDGAARRAPGLLQKYHGRALLVTTGVCAVHCRYCFRRHYPYQDEPRRLEDWNEAFATIAADPSIHEVILSGGDPLMLTDSRLDALWQLLSKISHVSRIRVHSRLPIVVPERMTRRLLEIFTGRRPTTILVVHANHAQEIAGSCAQTLQQMVRCGIPVLNQAVLLKGVNDSLAAQVELCETLVDRGVFPYYLHQLDRVAGAAHFETAEEVGVRLIEEMRKRLPGYAVPRYVRETAGGFHKEIIA